MQQHLAPGGSGEAFSGKIACNKHEQRHMETENPQIQAVHAAQGMNQRFNGIAGKNGDYKHEAQVKKKSFSACCK
ncbi:hypothetical protein D3C73_448520 [compost metagenome]